jgi:hypothetical protein
MDIVVPWHDGSRTGFLAEDAEEYAELMHHILSMPVNSRRTIQVTHLNQLVVGD